MLLFQLLRLIGWPLAYYPYQIGYMKMLRSHLRGTFLSEPFQPTYTARVVLYTVSLIGGLATIPLSLGLLPWTGPFGSLSDVVWTVGGFWVSGMVAFFGILIADVNKPGNPLVFYVLSTALGSITGIFPLLFLLK